MTGTDNGDEGDDDRTRIGIPVAPTPPTTPPDAAPETPDLDDDPFAEVNAEAVASTPPVSAPPVEPAAATQPPVAPVAQAPAPPDDDDRTQFVGSPTPPPAAEVTAAPVSAEQASDDEDRTQFAAVPTLNAPTDLQTPPDGGGGAAAVAAKITGGVATVTIGTRINNNYEVKEVLKAGGMGEVYRGENVFTGDPVAIKVVLPELAEDEKVGLMFKREARTLSQLSDEAIVRYYNFVKDPVIDRYCLIMEFISGVPLSDHTAEDGPISVKEAQVLLKRLAKGLAQAHDREVIHRDLSPDNVMLPDGVVAEGVLIDFGIAKSNVVKEGTMAGQFAGKFKYVSPEQLGHYGGEIGPASDIYGLALLMAAALMGQPLDMGSSIVEAVQSRQAIPDLSDVPVEFRPLFAFMLEPDPADRPKDMTEVGKLLEQPQLIPVQYRSGLPMPPSLGTSRPGPMAQNMTGVGGFISPPVVGMQHPPHTSAPTTIPPEVLAAARGKSGNGGKIFTGLLVLVAAGLGGGYYAHTQGMIELPFELPWEKIAEEVPDEPDTPNAPPVASTNTREGFLAAFDTGSCSFASRIAAGANAGMVQGFASNNGVFNGLPTAYEEQFGARPTLLERQVEAEQCAALDFVKTLQGRTQVPAQMQVTPDVVHSGEAISGQINDPLGRNVWLVLITPTGQLFNITGRLSEAVNNRRTFGFGLSLNEGLPEAPQLILAVSSEKPLVSASTARDGVLASDLLPAILKEIDEAGGTAVASLSYLLLQPPLPPEPEPEPVPEEGVTGEEEVTQDAPVEEEAPSE